jgi:hypothetical protein
LRHRIMILRMESSLMRTLKTKERLCYDTIDSDAILPQQRRPSGEKRAILAAVVVVTREAQEAAERAPMPKNLT